MWDVLGKLLMVASAVSLLGSVRKKPKRKDAAKKTGVSMGCTEVPPPVFATELGRVIEWPEGSGCVWELTSVGEGLPTIWEKVQ